MSGIWKYPLWALVVLLVGVVMCAQVVEHDEVIFSDLSIAIWWRQRLAWWATVLIYCSVFESRDRAHKYTKAVSKHLYYVQVIGGCSFTVRFQKSFCMRWISVCCMELRSACFFDVESVLIQLNRGQVICPTYRGSPLLEGTLLEVLL